MDKEKEQSRVEYAVELRHGGLNCAQAVALALTNDESLVSLASGFGGGMGNTLGPCGALSGAILVAGMKNPGKRTTPYSRRLYARFQELCGAVICRDLKGVETGQVLCSCDDCIRNAVRAYEEIFPENQN